MAAARRQRVHFAAPPLPNKTAPLGLAGAPFGGVLRTVSTDSVVLLQLRRKRWHFKNNRRGVRSEVGWLRKSFVLAGHPHPKGTSSGDASRPRQGAARRAHGSSALVHAMRDLIAS